MHSPPTIGVTNLGITIIPLFFSIFN
eukprot:COSAG02_NODE_54112_length_298_cov_0.517588_1_plen_25_part_01